MHNHIRFFSHWSMKLPFFAQILSNLLQVSLSHVEKVKGYTEIFFITEPMEELSSVRFMMQKPTKGKKRKNNALPIVLFIALGLIGMGVLVYQGVRGLTGNPIIKSQDDVPRLSVEEAYQAVRQGQAVLVDTRSVEQFAELHALGAINLPIGSLESTLASLDPEVWYITYCT